MEAGDQVPGGWRGPGPTGAAGRLWRKSTRVLPWTRSGGVGQVEGLSPRALRATCASLTAEAASQTWSLWGPGSTVCEAEMVLRTLDSCHRCGPQVGKKLLGVRGEVRGDDG